MNISLAVLVLWVVLLQGADVPAYRDMSPVVGASRPTRPPKADVLVGDRILRVDDRPVDTWDEFLFAIAGKASARGRAAHRTRRAAVDQARRADGEGKYEVGDVGVFPSTHPHIRYVMSGDPAERAGLQGGDVILAINGETVSFAHQLPKLISKHEGREIAVGFLRDGQTREVRITPVNANRTSGPSASRRAISSCAWNRACSRPCA